MKKLTVKVCIIFMCFTSSIKTEGFFPDFGNTFASNPKIQFHDGDDYYIRFDTGQIEWQSDNVLFIKQPDGHILLTDKEKKNFCKLDTPRGKVTQQGRRFRKADCIILIEYLESIDKEIPEFTIEEVLKKIPLPLTLLPK